MKRFSEQLKKRSDSIRLNTAEKRLLRERVISYMEYHPMPAQSKKEDFIEVSNEQTFKIINFNIKRFLQLSGSFVLLLALGVSYLAERAIPGDALYSIKVGFNEELRSTLARGSYEKVVWETERLNRRLAEARLLANEGRLTEEVEAQVASAVKVHSDNARKEIENLKLTDKDEATLASIELTTALDVQTTSLRNRGDSEPDSQSTALIETVLTESQAAEITSEEDNLPAYDRLMAKVESETTRAHELLKGVSKSATKEEQSDITRRLEDIERKMLSAMELFGTDEVAARHGLIEVLQQTHRLIIFMTNIDVRINLTVNEIVPVTLTNEERLTQIKKQTNETKALIGLINDTLEASSSVKFDLNIINKVRPAIDQSSTSVQKIESLLGEEPIDIDTTETLSLEAYNLAFDAAQLLSLATSTSEKVEEQKLEEIEVKESDESGTSTQTVIDEADLSA